MLAIVSDNYDDFCDVVRLSKARDILPHFLKKESIYWSRNMKKLIRILLVLPIGSADAERSFSIMNHIKTSRRGRINSDNLEFTMSIGMNGPKDLKDFDAIKYSKEWVKSGHQRSDDPMRRRANV